MVDHRVKLVVMEIVVLIILDMCKVVVVVVVVVASIGLKDVIKVDLSMLVRVLVEVTGIRLNLVEVLV